MLVPAFGDVPLKDFARYDSFDDAKLSPDGNYLALRVPIGDQFGLVIIDVATRKVLSKFGLGPLGSVAGYVWAGSNRLVVSVEQLLGPLDQPFVTGELLGFNVDGSGGSYLFGYRPSGGTGTMITHGGDERASAHVFRTLPDDPHHVIVAVDSWESAYQYSTHQSIACRLEVQNGHCDENVVSPIVGSQSSFIADDKGFVRYAIGRDIHQKTLSFGRSPEHPEWQPLNSGEGPDTSLVPGFMSKDNQRVYLTSKEDGDHDCLVREDLGGGARVKLSCDPAADLERTVYSFDDGEPVATVFETGIPRFDYLDTDNPARKTVQKLQEAFPGEVANPVSHTRDGSKAVVFVYSDRNPGEFYLFDTKTLHAEFLIAARGWIDPQAMAERRPVNYPARDGRTVYGYLTLPPGKPEKNLPLVVYPHGGPFWIREHWEWNAEAQAMASRGYAVLQVNFRGSGGFGERFFEEGRQSWDKTMIDDITDGARWAVSQGYADPRRMCIFGGSYGGYAAMMSVVREPDLYRCAIDYAGVVDLEKLKEDGDVSDTKLGRTYFAEFVGSSADRLHAASPITYLDQLKAAVLIVHGKEDKRVPYAQAKELRDAMDKRKLPYEWLVKAGEGHGFYDPDNRTELLEKLIAFLDKYIGPNAVLPAAPVSTVEAATPATALPDPAKPPAPAPP
jgi:acetyl esterase/lipase